MRIRVRLYASLTVLLPDAGPDHSAWLDVPEGSTAHDVLRRLEVPEHLPLLVMVDGVHLNRREVAGQRLAPGQTLAVFPPIAGGAA